MAAPCGPEHIQRACGTWYGASDPGGPEDTSADHPRLRSASRLWSRCCRPPVCRLHRSGASVRWDHSVPAESRADRFGYGSLRTSRCACGRQASRAVKSGEELIVGWNGTGIGGRRRRRRTQNPSENPIAAFHGAGAQRGGGSCEHGAHTEHSPAMEGVGPIHHFGIVRRFDFCRHAIVLRERFSEEG